MKRLISFIFAGLSLISCNYLEPIEEPSYNYDNLKDYPSYVQGFIGNGYRMLPSNFITEEVMNIDILSDDLVQTSQSAAMHNFSLGVSNPSNYPFENIWSKCYQAINYANNFLQDELGRSMRYMLDSESNTKLVRRLWGEAYAIRAWYQYRLLRLFGGMGDDKKLYGYVIRTRASSYDNLQNDVKRDTYEDCVKQIIADCDTASHYLPDAYRDHLLTDPEVDGSVGYQRFDRIAVLSIKALTLLQWASPAFNPDDDKQRWEDAARAAYEVIKLKLEVDGGHFDPLASFSWSDPNSAEIILRSKVVKNGDLENSLYPQNCYGKCYLAPSQNLVDAFPMANGYPIDDPRSGYSVNEPYKNRDPRLYEYIFFNGSKIITSNGSTYYEFNCSPGGMDEPERYEYNSRSGYYVKKYTYKDYYPYATTVLTAARCVFLMRWTHVLLAYAESANHAFGPLDNSLGLSAKEALSLVRSRSLPGGTSGLGAVSDPYLEECANGGEAAFDALVRNERRVETCFEGMRFFDLQRWSSGTELLNVDINKVKIDIVGGKYEYSAQKLHTHNLPSQWLPLPRKEVIKCNTLVQNAGYDLWK